MEGEGGAAEDERGPDRQRRGTRSEGSEDGERQQRGVAGLAVSGEGSGARHFGPARFTASRTAAVAPERVAARMA